jgi:hypothetical protein
MTQELEEALIYAVDAVRNRVGDEKVYPYEKFDVLVQARLLKDKDFVIRDKLLSAATKLHIYFPIVLAETNKEIEKTLGIADYVSETISPFAIYEFLNQNKN